MKKVIIAGLSVLLSAPMAALAYEQGDVLVRVGATSVQADDGFEPDGVSVDSNTQLGLNIVYMATNNIGVELLAASPFSHDIEIDGVGIVGDTKHLPPTLSAQYYFNTNSIVTPYLGAGLNYTIFFDENLDVAGVDNIELKNSVGLALQVGVDIALANNWGLNVDIRKIDIDTEVDSSGVAAADGVEVKVDPMVYSLTAVYKF